mmetsp:Transcript_42650/g.91482  ORF Transcript_42650/g.91482 Transcript_42650/m.91482 type:complete len:299 (-) Transcript_42650:940-1836(-)
MANIPHVLAEDGGPEEGSLVEGLGASDHALRCQSALAGGQLPVLHPHHLARLGLEAGDVSCSEQVRCASLETLIGDDGSVLSHLCPLHHAAVGLDADAQDDGVGNELLAAAQGGLKLGAFGFDRRGARRTNEGHALLLEEFLHGCPDLLAQDALEGVRFHADHCDLAASSLQGAGNLHADEGRADDQDLLAFAAFLCDVPRILGRSKRQHTRQVRARNRQRPRSRPCRQKGCVVLDLFARGEGDLLGLGVQLLHRRSKPHFDLHLLEVLFLPQQDARGVRAFAQVLRKHRAIVGQILL